MRLLLDARHSLRLLARHPGFALVAIVTLALGIGANTAIFSVVQGVLLKSLPYAEGDRLVHVTTEYPDGGRYPLSPPDFMSVHDDVRVFEDVVAYSDGTVTLTGAGDPTELQGLRIGEDFLPVLGLRPSLGRGFRPEEHGEGAGGVAILTHELWHTRFGGDPAVLGGTITVDGEAREVVGILPAGTRLLGNAEILAPLEYDETFSSTTAQGRRGEYLGVIARMKPGVTLDQAAAELETLTARLKAEFPDTNANQTIAGEPLHETLVGDVRTPLLVLLGAVGLVLLIACANVANLLLARAAGRESELAVRTALGAGRARLVRQLLTESMVLALLGGGLGLLLAWWGTQALVAARPQDIPRLDDVGLDGMVVAVALAASVLTGVLFGLLPALHSTRGQLVAALKEGGRGGLAGGRGNRVRSGLVVAETALAVVLLVGAGLLIRSFVQLTSVDPGFRAEQALSFKVALPYSIYDEAPARHDFFRRLEERLETLPGVTAVGGASGLPLTGSGAILSFRVEGQEPPAEGQVQDIHVKVATTDYFETIGAPLREGRTFTDFDRLGSPYVAVVNEAAARRWFPDGKAVGERFTFGGQNVYEVVGVVADLRQFGLNQDAQPEAFLAHQQSGGGGTLMMVVRATGDPAALIGAIRREVRALDPNLPLEEFTPLAQVVSESVARPRFYTALLSLFAGVALALAAVGIFGVISFTVAQRTREIGIRIALGAAVDDVLRMVVGRAMLLVLAGLALGVVASLALTRLLSSQLYGVGAADPVTYVAVAAVLAAVAFVASVLPARSATRVDPATALRHD